LQQRSRRITLVETTGKARSTTSNRKGALDDEPRTS
jgi:hypothetical protein